MVDKSMGLEEVLKGITPVDGEWIERARNRTSQLVMPSRALGRLHEISEQLCGIQKTLEPLIERKAFLVMAGDHGVV
ncbi:MAG: nicotinate-nucleotide--dimethylbenzimidazole phosphoribosyltransferase, partial [Desulfobacterales bacterium]|nr:nicotinate-nucleotide--dimethylbenzimidazole phosphoribosyltransferase [Desulfobacterales bacterium]